MKTKTTLKSFFSRALVYLLAWCLGVQPVLAAPVTISQTPLSTAGGSSVLPNLLFTLDSSGSMAWDYLPDYLENHNSGNNQCMTRDGGRTDCQQGDPVWYAGGVQGSNGVAYDPKFNYRPGLKADGTTVAAATLTTTAVPVDAYQAQSTSNIDITASIPDLKFCNENDVCLRSGTTGDNTTLASGTDGQGNTQTTGRFPYRTHLTNSSRAIFGLPEMMAMGTFSRSGGTVTVTTLAPHLMTGSGNRVYVDAGNGNLDTNAGAVTVVNANSFTYTMTGSQTVAATTGSFRPHTVASWSRPNSGTATQQRVITVITTGGHGLVDNDRVLMNSTSESGINGTFNVDVINTTTFIYSVGSTPSATSGTTSNTFWARTGLYNRRDATTGPALAYTITPVEYCTNDNLTDCKFVLPGNTPPSGYTKPAYVRFCRTQEQALAPGEIGDASGTPRCRSKFIGYGANPDWRWARYGWFVRENIVSAAAPFSGRPNRADCNTSGTAPNCTYTQEIQNYARWYTYYRTRMQMMKTAAGRAFQPLISNPSATPLPISDKLRVGFITINPEYNNASNPSNQGSVQSSRYLKIDTFRTAHAGDWYTKFYAQIPAEGTPLREALSRAGWIYAGKLNTGLTDGIPVKDDPVLASCQRHYTLLTTDGYWNGNNGKDLAGNAIGNADNGNPITDAPYTQPSVDRPTGTFDGGVGTSVTSSTPTTQIRQVECKGNLMTTFAGGGGQTACGCSSTQHRIMERTTVTTTSSVTIDDVLQPGSPTSSTDTFAPAAAPNGTCSAANYAKTTAVVQTKETLVCNRANGPNPVTFADGSTKSCNFCSNNDNGDKRVLIRLTRNYNQITTKVDGVTTDVSYTPNGAGTTYEYNRSVGSPSWSTTVPSNSGGCNDNDLSDLAGTTTGAPGSSSPAGSGTGVALTLMTPNPSAAAVGTPTSSTTLGGYPDTLADVAMYYYRTDLRGGKDFKGNATGSSTNPASNNVAANNVPNKSGAKNFVTHQHMVTFTVGLVDGFMRYQSDYDADNPVGGGDFKNIKNGTVDACFWQSGACNWPRPVDDTPSALDDLWHAAVNGRGQYYLANNVDALAAGLQNTLTALSTEVAAAAASATSSPNVTQTDNQIFSTTYETNTWAGRVFAQTINSDDGTVNPAIQWQADTLLLSKVNLTADSRAIWTFAPAESTKLKSFEWATLTTSEADYFKGKCDGSGLPAGVSYAHCGALTGAQQTTVNGGSALVGFLRGQLGNEATLFRDRTFIDVANNNAIVQTVLGDTISAKPAYLRAPTFNYGGTYDTFRTDNAGRSPRVYVGANDGYLHAFNGTTGVEEWAYMPRFLMPKMYLLADKAYATKHEYFVDGSPETADVYDTTAGVWKSILVGGTAGGGQGYYALDVTDPSNPKGLWEFCSSAAMCPVSSADLGLSYGNPVIGKRLSDSKWVVVVTSGLNNVGSGATGHGKFFVLDAITGAILDTVDTGVGDTTNPAGLMKISGFFNSALTDPTFQYVYGGDQLGNVWRLDLGAATPVVTRITTLKSGTGTGARGQPITTRPTLTHIGADRVLYIGTGRYLGLPDLSDQGATGPAWQQSLYAFKDKDYVNAAGGKDNLRVDPNLVVRTLTQITPTDRGISNSPVVTMDWNTKDGWYVDFNPSFDDPETVAVDPQPNSPGEGVNLVDPRLILGTVAVATNVPASGGSQCAVGGTSYFYNFDFKSGMPVSTAANGVVGSSLGGTITVGVAIVQLPDGTIKSISTGADTSKTTSNVNTSTSGTSVKPFSYRLR